MYHSRVLSDLLWTGVHYTELTSIVKGHASGETMCSTRCYPAGVVKSAFVSSQFNCKATKNAKVVTFGFENLCCQTKCVV